MTGGVWSLALTTFLASLVEMVEALTIVVAMGVTRGWRSALWGVAAAVAVLAVFTAVAGYSLTTWLPRSALQLGVGALMLVFGLQWLHKAVLRSTGLKALSDESARFDRNAAAGRAADARGDGVRLGLDWFGFVVSFKGVFLEGTEVVFIVLTLGLNADDLPVAALAAVVAAVVVLIAGVFVHGPLTRVPENTVKLVVGLLLTTFGTFWSVEGLGSLRAGGRSVAWPGGDLAIPLLLLGWLLVSRLLVTILQRRRAADPSPVSTGRTS